MRPAARPRRGRPAKRSPEEYRSLIVRAALEVTAEVGIENATLARITERAGIGYGTVYRFFESRETLLLFVLETQEKLVIDEWRAASSISDPIDRIVAICCAPLRHVRADPASKTVFVSLVSGAVGSVQGAMELAARAEDVATSLFAAAIEEARPAGWFRNIDTRVASATLLGVAAIYRSRAIPDAEAQDEGALEGSIASIVRALAAGDRGPLDAVEDP